MSPEESPKESFKLKLLREKIEWPKNSYSHFIPNSVLELYVNVVTVECELGSIYQSWSKEDVRRYADLICDVENPSKKVFVILLCAMRGDRQTSIQKFLDDGITDKDLPFRRVDSEVVSSSNPHNIPFTLCSKDHDGCPLSKHTSCGINAMCDWGQDDIGELCKFQWLVQAPIFWRSDKSPIPHIDLDLNVVMPFIEDQELHKLKPGGFSEVWGVRIHHSHQNVYKPSGFETEEPLLAVKRLFSREKAEFEKELYMLTELTNKHHQNLVKLLATYKLKGQYYLLFPFAVSNLRDHWEAVPNPYWNRETVLWALDQIAGLASGLDVIHNFRTNVPLGSGKSNAGLRRLSRLRDSATNTRLDVRKGEEMFGRHGDLKPENVLCSVENGHTMSYPVLQITDLGLGRFHGFNSRTGDNPKTYKGSPSYIPPEIPLAIPVSRAYDIWSLGCIYLEMITWLLEGREAIYDFATARNETALDDAEDDTFFSLKRRSPDNSTYAEIRGGVLAWTERLRGSERCSSMVQDLLDLISNEMLQVQTRDRISSADLKSKLNGFLAQAQHNTTYLLGSNSSQDQETGLRVPDNARSNATFSSCIAANNPLISVDPPSD